MAPDHTVPYEVVNLAEDHDLLSPAAGLQLSGVNLAEDPDLLSLAADLQLSGVNLV